MNKLLTFIITVLAAVFAFKVNIFLGIAFIVITIICIYFSNYSAFMAGRANAEFNNGNTELALKYYKKALSRGSKFTTNLGYASILLRSGRPEEALNEVNKVLSYSNVQKDIIFQAKQTRALINYKLGEVDEAFDEAFELFDDGYTTSIMYCLVGLLMLASNKPIKEALDFCEQAYDYDDDSRDIVDNYLLALINAKEYEKAKEISEKLIELAPEFVEAHYHSAMLYKALGDNEKAKEFLEKIPDCKRTYMTTVSEQEIESLKSAL